MSTLVARPSPGRRGDYVRFLPLTLRLMDNDVFGHVNNVHYYSLFDTTICEFLTGQGILRWDGSDLLMMMAESGCRYHSEIAFPDQVEGAMRVARIGERSVRYEVAVFRGNNEFASAEGFMVHVCVSSATRRPVALPAAWREILATLVLDER